MAQKVTRTKMGRPSRYKREYAKMAKQVAKLGATDAEWLTSAESDSWLCMSYGHR
jgi:hypothetical protein